MRTCFFNRHWYFLVALHYLQVSEPHTSVSNKPTARLPRNTCNTIFYYECLRLGESTRRNEKRFWGLVFSVSILKFDVIFNKCRPWIAIWFSGQDGENSTNKLFVLNTSLLDTESCKRGFILPVFTDALERLRRELFCNIRAAACLTANISWQSEL